MWFPRSGMVWEGGTGRKCAINGTFPGKPVPVSQGAQSAHRSTLSLVPHSVLTLANYMSVLLRVRID